MSIYAMNWALRQRLDSPNAQILLYVIADSADATGKTTHCDPDYMADRARMSRPTLYRRLGELEEIGLLQRFKSYSEHGAQVYEIRLNFDCVVELPIRGRRSDDDDGAADDAKTHTQTSETGDATERPKSHIETPVCTAKVSPVRQPESHSGDFQEDPPISKDSPLPPKGGERERRAPLEYPDLFAAAWSAWPGHEVMRRDLAIEEFRKLSVEQQRHCRAAIPQFVKLQSQLRRTTTPNFHMWIRTRGFEEFPAAATAAGAATAATSYGVDSAEGRAIKALFAFARVPLFENRGFVIYPLPVSPQVLAFGSLPPSGDWHWIEDRNQLAAWSSFLTSLIHKPRPELLTTRREGDEERRGMLVPWPWPPRKDGTISDDQQGAA